ncbi:hypothetical protein Pcinc_002041 [Petrolisthes cinctipes]|uniref:Chromosome transmission fidelity protein 8 homolog n=1 Tax=Petrolisthes cinctipes TaxID=88211 RepID=A0AAE1GM59_PETCI|nr:hypothetical protein Pcinc_002041 [Petrolisthes cinctipes]
MQIPIKISNDGSEEWMMLELQGDLESRTQTKMSNKFIGDLHFTKQGVPVLIIGHHILYGKVMDMDKPFVIMNKIQTDTCMEVPESDTNEELDVLYNIKAVVKKKLIFKNRPKPIIASSVKNV